MSEATTTRTATTPTWGALRDAAVGTVAAAAGAAILGWTGNTEISHAASQFGGTTASVTIGALFGVVTFGRKWMMDKFSK